jgi:hypothetical protein
MPTDFLAELLGNQTRARVLRLFTIGPDTERTLDDVRKKTQIKNPVLLARELAVLTRLGVLKTGIRELEPAPSEAESLQMQKKSTPTQYWIIDREYPHAQALRLFVRDTQAPIDEGVVTQLRRTGRLRLLVVSGGFVDSDNEQGRIDLLLVGEAMNEEKIQEVLRGIEAQRGREMQYAIFSPKEFKYRLDVQDRLIRDVLDYPHRVLFDKLNLL